MDIFAPADLGVASSFTTGNLLGNTFESAQPQFPLALTTSFVYSSLGLTDRSGDFHIQALLGDLDDKLDLPETIRCFPRSSFSANLRGLANLRHAPLQVDALIGRSTGTLAADPLTNPTNAGSRVAGVVLNNSLSQATNIGTLSGTRSFRDFVGSSDRNDYYRLNLNQNSNFALTLDGLSADADVQLLNSNGTMLQSSTNAGSAAESINQSLTAGTYYVRVYQYTGNTNYNLTLAATPLASFNSTYGHGLINAAAAVTRALGQSNPFPSVPDLGGHNWGNDMVNAPEVWAWGYTGRGIVVAVIDSGVDINHPDLRNNIWRNTREIPDNGIDDDRNGYTDDINGWNFGFNQNNNNVLPGTRLSKQGHGTHVAGTIAASNNGIGITGVAHQARIMPIRMGDMNSQGSFTNPGDLATAIRYAVNNGAHVINMSLGWFDSPALRDALAYAASRNVITVSAAGNFSLLSPDNPAQYATQYGLSVGAVDSTRRIANFSNRAGSNSAMRHVVAPGVGVYSTLPNNRYDKDDGTSMAAPHVAGVVALMLSANPNLTHAQVRQIVTDSTARLS